MGWDRAFGLALHASAHHGAASNGLGPCAFGLALHASAHHGAGTPQIRSNGLPAAFAPLVICVAGTGNVSRGAIDAIKALGDDVIEWVSDPSMRL
jgi:hypothetical protein